MNEKELDLSAFPIIRLDQLSLLSQELLSKAISEIREMISNEENGSKMYNYLMKQFNAMKVEEAQRLAEKRINDILSGNSSLSSLNPNRYDDLFTEKPTSDDNLKNEKSKSENTKHNSTEFTDNETKSRGTLKSSSSVKIFNNPSSNDLNLITITPIKKKSRRQSASALEISNPSQQNILDKAPPRPPSPTISVISSISDTPPPNVTVKLSNPSFGIEFVVAATERKRRRPLPKKNDETPEQIREKEKNQRRQEAIKRLMKRREEQAEAQAKLKEIQRLKKIQRLEKEKEEKEKEKELEKLQAKKESDNSTEKIEEKTKANDSPIKRSLSFVSSQTSSSQILKSSSQPSLNSKIDPEKNNSPCDTTISLTDQTDVNENNKECNVEMTQDSNRVQEENNFNNLDDHDDDLNELDDDIETDNVISSIPIVLDEELIEAAKESFIGLEKGNIIVDNKLGSEISKDQCSLINKEIEEKKSTVELIITSDENIVENDSSTSRIEIDSSTSRIENDSSRIENDSSKIENDSSTSRIKNDSSRIENNEMINFDENQLSTDNSKSFKNLNLQYNDNKISEDSENNKFDKEFNENKKIHLNEAEDESQISFISDSESLYGGDQKQELEQSDEVFKELEITNKVDKEDSLIDQVDLSSLSIHSNDSPKIINDNKPKDDDLIIKEHSKVNTISNDKSSRPISVKSLKSRNSSSQLVSKPLPTSNNNNNNNNNNNPVKLSDYYSNIRQIFTCTYINSTPQIGSQPDSDYIARTLIEAIQFQISLYEEWIEIMRDYSTVYCLNDGDYEDDSDAKEKSSQVYPGSPSSLHYSINSSSHNEVFNIVSDAFEERIHPQLQSITNSVISLKSKWVPLPSGLGLGPSWNLLWTWSRPRGLLPQRLLVWQKTNHFQHSGQLTRKDLLKKNLEYLCGKINNNLDTINRKEFDIMPLTFLLPQEYSVFVQSFVAASRPNKDQNSEEKKEKNIWILKPIGLSRGRGISLVQSLDELKYSQASVIQKYVENPLCLNGFKFDLRLYVLVTSFHPLEAFIFTDGFARVSTEKFSLSSSDIANKFIHLTNSSIQKHQKQEVMKDNPLNEDKKMPTYSQNEDEIESDVGGTKISLLGKKGLWARLKEANPEINIEEVWKNIKILVLKSLIAVDEKIPYQPSSFELFGYDVLIDDDLKPWLIEVNASPSLARENLLDNKVKDSCIRDIMKLINPAPFNRQELIRVLKKRLNDIRKQKINPKKKDNGNLANFDQELEDDLRAILNYNNNNNQPDFTPYIPRRYGELPSYLGGFEPIAPNTKEFDHVVRLKRKIYKTTEYDNNIATI